MQVPAAHSVPPFTKLPQPATSPKAAGVWGTSPQVRTRVQVGVIIASERETEGSRPTEASNNNEKVSDRDVDRATVHFIYFLWGED